MWIYIYIYVYMYNYVYIIFWIVPFRSGSFLRHVWLPEGMTQRLEASPRHQEDAFVVQQAHGPDAADRVGDDGHLCAQGIQLVPKLPGHVLQRKGCDLAHLQDVWGLKKNLGTSNDFQWTYF